LKIVWAPDPTWRVLEKRSFFHAWIWTQHRFGTDALSYVIASRVLEPECVAERSGPFWWKYGVTWWDGLMLK
jgi:hypothetical protein